MASTYKMEFLNGRPPQPIDLGWFCYIQFYPDDSAPDYIGLNVDNAATDIESTWKVYKFTYVGSAVTKIQLAYGSWTGRAALFP